MSELARADTIKVGDRVQVGVRTGLQVVAEIQRDDTYDELTVWYFLRGERAWSRGPEYAHERLVQRCLRPLSPGELLLVERGTPEAASELRAELERQDAEAVAKTEAKWGR